MLRLIAVIKHGYIKILEQDIITASYLVNVINWTFLAFF